MGVISITNWRGYGQAGVGVVGMDTDFIIQS